MKTLIKKNFYYENNFAGQYEGRFTWERRQVHNLGFLGDRGFTFGGSSSSDVIAYFSIGTAAAGISSADFGEMLQGIERPAAVSSRYRIIRACGNLNPTTGNTNTDVIEYITAMTLGAAIDFGDYLYVTQQVDAVSDGNRGVIAGGSTTPGVNTAVDTIAWITIGTEGNASDFGELTQARHSPFVTTDGNRGIFSMGGPGSYDTMDYISIGSLGDCVDFGEATAVRTMNGGIVTDGSRGVFMGGGAANTDIIDFITISITGNAMDFGDLLSSRGYAGQTSNGSRGVVCHGEPGDGATKEWINIRTAGNAVDAGEMHVDRTNMPGAASGG